MGTSTSSKGANKKSSLVPSWANDNNEPVPNIERDLGGFRAELGRAASGQAGNHLKRALGYYATNATGGQLVGPKRYQTIIKAGGGLFDLLQNAQAGNTYLTLNLAELNGQPTDIVIDKIIEVLLEVNGDSEIIRASLNQSLSECLEGVEEFDATCISDDFIVDLMIGYTKQFLFQQIMLDSKASFDKADTLEKQFELEQELYALIQSSVDRHMGRQLRENQNRLNRNDIECIQRLALEEIWAEWEDFLND